MKIPGDSMGKFLSLLIFKIILVSFIIFTAIKLVVHILVENISGVSAHRRENLERLNQSLIGKSIMDPAPNSKPMLTFGEKHPATEQYLASIKQKDSVTSKKQDNFS
jgi:dolichyl-phosphate-mannose--protein O-mannosyl transferase